MSRLGAALEDALRVSDLPGDDGRLVLVRTLALGELGGTRGGAELPRRVEEAMVAGSRELRHGGEAGAARSNAVWFRDALEAHARLAERVLSGTAADEWYWRLAVSGWQGSGNGLVTDALSMIARSLAKLPEAPAALPAWCAVVCQAGGAGELDRVFATGDGLVIAEAAGFCVAAPDRPERGRASEDDAGRAPPVRRSTKAGGDERRRSAHLSSLEDEIGLGGDSPPGSGHEEGVGPTGLLELMLEQWGRQALRRPPWEVGPPSIAGDSGSGPWLDFRSDEDTSSVDRARLAPQDGAHPPSSGIGGDDRPSTPVSRRSTPPKRGRPWLDEHTPGNPTAGLRLGASAAWRQGRTTVAAGLPFVINVLARLEFESWIEGAPEWEPWEVARRVLTRTLADARVPDTDPAWALSIDDEPPPKAPPPAAFSPPRSWSDLRVEGSPASRVRSRSGLPASLDALGAWPVVGRAVDAWSTTCDAWLRRWADMDLETLILRRGRILATPTHVDTWFALSQVDLRLRRAGLDIDPGWVPWMGRVVAFHYEADVVLPGDVS